MVIVKLKGGLGNQLFQYALGRKLSLLNNCSLFLDQSGLQKEKKSKTTRRSFSLLYFNIQANYSNRKLIESLKCRLRIFYRLKLFFLNKILRNNNIVFNDKVLTQKGDIYLDGFWQSPLYFDDIRDILIKDLSPRNKLQGKASLLLPTILNSNSVSIHVRRGDYVNDKKVKNLFGPCSTNYFSRATLEANKRIKDPFFFIFSDDQIWAKREIKLNKEKVIYVNYKISDQDQFWLMVNCKHQIISNSSYSWWAAWLNRYPNKLVIAPFPWFDKIKYDKDLIPYNWLTIPK
jgi:hypothetical protein